MLVLYMYIYIYICIYIGLGKYPSNVYNLCLGASVEDAFLEEANLKVHNYADFQLGCPCDIAIELPHQLHTGLLGTQSVI